MVGFKDVIRWSEQTLHSEKLAMTEKQSKTQNRRVRIKEGWRCQRSCGVYWNSLDTSSELVVTVKRTCCILSKLLSLKSERMTEWPLRENVVITYWKYVLGPMTHTYGPWSPAAGPCPIPILWHLLCGCPWLTLPWYSAGERKNYVGCLSACLLPPASGKPELDSTNSVCL